MLGGDGTRLEANEIAVRAAKSLMRVPFITGNAANFGLFHAVDEMTKLVYEGKSNLGKLIFADKDDPNVSYVLRLETPVSLRQTRWMRKIVQMASRETGLIVGYHEIFGLGSMSDISAPPFVVDIIGYHQWNLCRGKKILMVVRQGRPQLPKRPFPSELFHENMRRIFEGISDEAVVRAENIMDLLFELGRGSMVVFSADAAQEAERLDLQGTRIQPTALTMKLLEQASSIDGTILADPNGTCYAVGVILDGNASPNCTPARGSRYNSAVRYVGDGSIGRMALVISDDRTVDVIPFLRPQIDSARLQEAVDQLSTATLDNFHAPRKFLDEHRFYLDSVQCELINSTLDRIEAEPREVGEIVLVTRRFEPNPEMNGSFFKTKRSGSC